MSAGETQDELDGGATGNRVDTYQAAVKYSETVILSGSATPAFDEESPHVRVSGEFALSSALFAAAAVTQAFGFDDPDIDNTPVSDASVTGVTTHYVSITEHDGTSDFGDLLDRLDSLELVD
jgi:hypothetical protein